MSEFHGTKDEFPDKDLEWEHVGPTPERSSDDMLRIAETLPENCSARMHSRYENSGDLDAFNKLFQTNDPSQFVMGLNYSFVAKNENSLALHRKEMERLLYGWLSGEGRLRSSEPQFKKVPRTNSQLVRWSWQHHNRISYCYVAIHDEFFSTPEEAGNRLHRLEVDDHRRFGGGIELSAIRRKKVYVTVWAVIDLGWLQVCGPPLHLSPTKKAMRSSRP